MARLTGVSRTIGALAVLTAVTVGGATVGDAGPTGAVPEHASRTGNDRPDPPPSVLLNPTIRDSIRAALGRVREHDPLPERAPDREPRNAQRSPARVAVQYAESGIPAIAAQAYHQAARNIDAELPACHLDWSLLAGIGRIESDHGRFGGALASPNGDISPVILGPALTGEHGTARIADTDNGEYDGNRRVDRAVGPMQFLPGTWAIVGADGNGDGTADPNNLFDAALGAAEYLCAGDRDLSTPAGRHAAVFSYNHSEAYVAEVLGLAALYREGRTPAVPTPTGPAGGAAADKHPARARHRAGRPDAPTRQKSSSASHRRGSHRPGSERPGSDRPGSDRPDSDRPSARPTPSTSPSTSDRTPPSDTKPPTSSPNPPSSNPPSSNPPSSSPPSSSPPSSGTPTTPPAVPSRPDTPRIKDSADPVIATTATPTFTVSGSDGQLVYTFELWPADHQGKPIGGGTFRAGTGQDGQWTVKDGDALAGGESYALRVRATNSAGTSDWSPWLDFTVTLPTDPSSSTPPSSDPSGSTPPSSDPSSSPSSSPSGSDQLSPSDSPASTPTPTSAPS
ncbi:MAG TPA: hypothetical protein VHC49_04980 [Mycobacteriales bacterium]|nr:hypothetical protein [Mycobacteriales bacterium]